MLKLSAILLFALALAACSGSGGGSDGGNDPVDDTSDNNSSEVTLQAIAGPDQSVNEGEEVVLEGSSEVSDTNLSLSYSWEQVGGSAVTLSGADNRVASFSPIVDADSELNFRLLVQTDTGIEATDELVVSVNNAPTAIIEGVSSVAEGLSVSLNGRQSFDSDDGSIVFYEWSQLGGNSVELVYEDHATVSFAAPLVNGDENLSFELAVTDDDSAVGRSTFIVEVMDDTENPAIAAVYLDSGDYGIGTSMAITLTAIGAESNLMLRNGSSFNGQELTDFAPVSGQDGNYTAIYTVAETDPSQDDGASVSANIILVDPAGNESAAIAEVALDGVSIDTLPPELDSISVSAGDYGIGASVEITVVAANAETDLSLRVDSSFNGETLTDFTAVEGKDGYYTAIYTVASGNLDLSPAAEANMSLTVLDTAGNESLEYVTTTLSDATSIDANAPVITSVGVASGDHGIGKEIRISITASDTEIDLILSPDANSFNGRTLIQFGHIDSGIYSAIYTVSEGDDDVASNSSVNTNIALVDAHGNVGATVASVLLSNSSIDATRPQLSALSISDGVYGIASDVVIFLSAAENESGLELQDSTFNGNSLAGFSDLQDGLYALTYTVASGDSDQADGADVAANITVVDSVGNTSLSITAISLDGESIDANAPIIESISVAAGDHGIGDAVEIVINTSEADLALAAGSTFNGHVLTGFGVIGDPGNDYVVTYTVIEGDSDVSDGSSVVTDIAFIDAAQNLGLSTQSALLKGAAIDANRPEIASVAVDGGKFGVGDDVVVTLTVVDSEVGLTTLASSSFNGGTLNDISDNGDGTYSTTYTVSEGDLDIADGGTVITDIALTDDAGNVGASIESLLFAGTSIDANSPSIALVSVAAGSYGVGAVIPVTITASAKELGLTLASSLFNGHNLTNITDNLDGNYSASYTVEEGDADVADGSAVTINLAFEDAYTNVGAAKESLILSGASIDANSPTITSVSVATGTFIIGDDVLITITAGDSENGLALKSDSSFNGQQLSDFSATDQDGVYTAVCTVAAEDTSFADGDTVSLNIALLDAVGNESAAVTEVMIGSTIVDTTVPSIYEVSVSEDNVVNGNDDLTKVLVTGKTSNVEDGQPLTINIGGISSTAAALVSADDDDNGGFSTTVDLSSLSDGTYPITIDVADISGNKAHFTGDFIKDTEAPTIDSVVVSADDVINSSDTLSAVAVSVSTTGVEDGQKVSLNISGVMLEVAITSNGFDGVVDLSELGDGTEIVVSGDVYDVAGNAASTFTKANFVIKDTVAPSIDSVTISTDDVINSSDTLSAVAVLISTTGVEDGQKLSLSVGGITTEVSITSDGFDGTVDLSVLGDGTEIVVSGDVSDVAGNAAATFTKANFVTKDTVAPSIDSVTIGTDDVINSSDTLSAVAVSVGTTGVEDGQKVSLDIGGVKADVSITSKVFDGTVDLSGLDDSVEIVVSGNVSDVAGNAAAIFTKASFVIKDTVAPSIDSVTISTDDVINSSDTLSAVLISVGTTGVEDGQKVSLDIGGVMLELAITSNGFDGTVDLSGLGDGTEIVVSGEVSDVAGNASETFAKANFVIKDTVAPSIDSVIISADDVINSSDTLSAVAVSVVTTGVEDSQKVSLDIGGVTADVSITNNGFDGTVDLSGLDDSVEIVVSGNVSDVAGNAALQFADSIVVDTIAPSQAVTLSSIKLSNDTGSSNTDFITNTAEQTISAELNAILGTGDVLYASVDDGSSWAKIYTDGNLSGNTKFSWTTTLPAEGNSSIQFQVADSADNNGSLTEQNYTLDITAPSLAVKLDSLSFDNDTGTADDDFITNTAEQSISAELNASLGSGDVLYASVDDGANWAKIYTDSNLSGNTSFSWTTSLPAEGNSSIQFQVADSADNNGSLTEQNYTLDITAPSLAVKLDSLSFDNDTGTADDDFITNTAAQTISAELNASLGSGDVLYASVDDGANWAKIYTDSNLSGNTSFSWTTSLPAEGNSSIQFQVADSADNNGSLTEQNYTLDQTAPSQAVTLSSIKLSTDTGSSNTDFITNTAEQTISAELNASLGSGDVLYASVDDGANWAKIYTDSNLSGNTSFSWTTSLPAEGNSSIQFQVADSADNNGSLTEQNYTLDQTAPSLAVKLDSLSFDNDTGTADDDFITNTAEQTISAELNAILGSGDVLYASVDDGASWAKIYTDSNLSGSTSFSWTTSLPAEGNSSIQFQVADSADNNGSLTEQNYTLDQTAPSQAVTLSSIKLSNDTGSSNTDFITNTAEQSISAELNASLSSGDVLYASIDDGANWAKIYTDSNLSGSISFSWTTSLPAEGNSSIQFQVADSADNNGSLTEQNYTLDQTEPSQAVTLSSIKLSTDTGSSNTDFITNTAEQTISAELNASLSSGDVLYASVDGGSTWQQVDSSNISGTSISWPATLLNDTNTIQFQVVDSADNNGSLTEQNYTLDQTAPSQAVTLSSIKLSTDTGSSNTDFITNTAEQSISAELNAILGTGDVLYASVDDGASWAKIYTDSNLSDSTSFSWTTSLPAEGNSSIQFQVADSADNNGSFTEQNYTLDQTAPSQAVTLSSIKLSTDTGSSNTDFITNTAEQTISAELNASLSTGDVLYASVDSGSTWQQDLSIALTSVAH